MWEDIRMASRKGGILGDVDGARAAGTVGAWHRTMFPSGAHASTTVD